MFNSLIKKYNLVVTKPYLIFFFCIKSKSLNLNFQNHGS